MLEIKIQCDCGQRYKFDVEPRNGRMPFTVNCPICGVEGTEKANIILQQFLSSSVARHTEKPMQQQPSTPAGINLADIYHVLFRHKWKMIGVWLTGALVAAVLWAKWPVRYQSEATLYVPYVLDIKPLNPIAATDATVQTIDQNGQGILNSELEILNSFDLAQEVAATVGPDRIMAKVNGSKDPNAAAGYILGGLNVEGLPRSAVIRLVFQHPDPEMVQPILSQLITSYLKKHAEIHQAAGTLDEYLYSETEQLKNQLSETEKELREAKRNANVISIDDTKKQYSEQIARIENELVGAESQLAQHRATLKEMQNLLSVKTDSGVATNKTASVAAAAPAAKISEYRRICATLDSLAKKRDEISWARPDSGIMTNLLAEIDHNEKVKAGLEDAYPQLTGIRLNSPSAAAVDPSAFTQNDVRKEEISVHSYEAVTNSLNQTLADYRKQLAAVNEAEGPITELQRKRDFELQKYQYFYQNLERNRFEESSKTPNIKPIQKPSPPFRDTSKIRKKIILLLFGAFAGGLGFAFVFELLLDRSFKRPIEIEAKLGLPLFAAIPETHLNGHRRLGLPGKRALPAPAHNGNGHGNGNGNGNGAKAKPETLPAVSRDITPMKTPAALQPFFEALRDRLITYFEIKNMTHKPKLVAVTSCGEGAGVTTIASGLAASLSETGDGNVLLVDMNIEHGAAHYFHKGKLAIGLDDALETEKRTSAQVQDNLYVVAGTHSDKLPRVLHKQFSTWLPKLKASDYDYIIFDMPPVSQISATAKLARFMDTVFMVVEAEKTDRDVVKRATRLLTESKANVGIVMNKTRNYVPRLLHQDL
jgi:succinoglycan biosynthesis transport protein ExoP